MSAHHELQVQTAVPGDDLLAVLSARPTRWLRGFLLLAVLAAGADLGAVVAAPPWYRVGGPVADESGPTALQFTWWPHVDAGLFTSFKGRFVIRPRTDGAVLVLSGGTTGGDEDRNAAVLGRLLDLIAMAISADQRPEGYSMIPSRTAVATASSFE